MSYPPTFLNELSNILGPGYDIDVHGPALHITHTSDGPGAPLSFNLPPVPFPFGSWGKLRVISTAADTLRLWMMAGRLSEDDAARARKVLAHLESPAVRLLAGLYPDFSVEPAHIGHLRVRYMPHFHGPATVISEGPDVAVMLDVVRSKFSSPHRSELSLKVGGIPWPILAAGAARSALNAFELGRGTNGDSGQRSGSPTIVALGAPDGGGAVYRAAERSPFDGRSGAPPWTPGTSLMAAHLGLGG